MPAGSGPGIPRGLWHSIATLARGDRRRKAPGAQGRGLGRPQGPATLPAAAPSRVSAGLMDRQRPPARRLVTLTGYLGRDRETCLTRQPDDPEKQARTIERYNPIAEDVDRFQIPIRRREYARISLALPRRVGGQWTTRWVTCIFWDVYEEAPRQLLMARKGDRVRVTGYWTMFRTTDPNGQVRELDRFILTSFERLRLKVTHFAS